MSSQKATSINLLSFSTPQMRAFHMSWLAFFVCFFAWFAVAPLMPVIKGEFHLTPDQIANINIAAVGITILVRLVVGPLCDRFGPRRSYTALLALGAIPVIGIAFANSYEGFLAFRLAIGAIGASFVITQFHTSVMFAPNVVGTANATVGGWGNSGGGVTQTIMPLLLAAIVSLGVGQGLGWRYAMIVPGVMMLIVSVMYWTLTQDTPEGDIVDLRRRGIAIETGKEGGWAVFRRAAANYRVWVLALCYAASFGIELFIHNVAASYYVDRFGLTLASAGFAAGSFGLLALFARALGGLASDRVARGFGLRGRTGLLVVLLLGEGIGLLVFSKMSAVSPAILAMLAFGLFTHMSCGAIYAIVPFVDRKALGGVTGIVGAGGNVGGVAAGFLVKGLGNLPQTLFVIGCCVVVTALVAALVRFSVAHQDAERALYDEALKRRNQGRGMGLPVPEAA
ncbi:MFS transporter [Lichenihabitans sp. Uapishka_5]|uniref:MFS transporter n=1 Tax=Lichenihabitans sp. Uapishka_5 TaxID=3037302 RepID=UPI0029E80F5F|nr:MFS transporter [Lichenihabitans sp. Uapishka_5]MDX7949822.1 MFS transporter [Lichenihabitans sp. Uapishka_5]